MPPQPVSGVHSVLHPQIWTPRQHPTGVQISNHQESGRHVDTQQASNSTTTKNLDATSTPNRRPNQQPPRIWTPRQPPTGVQSAIHPQIWTPRQPPTGVHSALDSQSRRRADTQQASKSATTKNLDATPTPKGRPNQQPPRIWTPRQPPTGVQSALHPQIWTPRQPVSGVHSAIDSQSGRCANTQQASKSATTKNLDAAPARKWRPIRPTPQIWTPPQPPTGVQSAIHLQSGRHHNTQQASNPP